MASRRTRIKGIANIPQRRKPGATSINTETPQNNTEDENNLTAEPNLENTIIIKDTKQLKTPEIIQKPGHSFIEQPPETKPKDTTTPQIVNNESNLKENAICDITEEIDKKPVVPLRRRFIKPTVSLNAINRKVKETALTNDEKNTQALSKSEFIANSGGSATKITILDEFITRPDHSEEISLQKSEEKTLSFASPPPNILSKVSMGNTGVLNSDIEYPIPPPSPNKVNRSRIKAVPRLGQRHTSFSASESEDESRRNYRHRNDSVSYFCVL